MISRKRVDDIVRLARGVAEQLERLDPERMTTYRLSDIRYQVREIDSEIAKLEAMVLGLSPGDELCQTKDCGGVIFWEAGQCLECGKVV